MIYRRKRKWWSSFFFVLKEMVDGDDENKKWELWDPLSYLHRYCLVDIMVILLDLIKWSVTKIRGEFKYLNALGSITCTLPFSAVYFSRPLRSNDTFQRRNVMGKYRLWSMDLQSGNRIQALRVVYVYTHIHQTRTESKVLKTEITKVTTKCPIEI